jgi:alpha-tubulin suppressor-like RCC1 family protein
MYTNLDYILIRRISVQKSLKKLAGFASVFMLGAVIGLAIISKAEENFARQQNEDYARNYLYNKKAYVAELASNLEHLINTENTYDGTIDSTRVSKYLHTNIYDVTDGAQVTTSGTTDGEKLATISLEAGTYRRSDAASVSLDDNYSSDSTVLVNEKQIRDRQLVESYKNMKKQAIAMYETELSEKDYKWPCTLTSTYQDVWNRDFTYTRTDDAKAALSFNYPWDNTKSLTMPIELPELPVINEIGVKDIIGTSTRYLITKTGEVWGVGTNASGQIGIGNTVRQTTWQKTSLVNIERIYKIGGSAFAITASGDLWVAGLNDYGQLGVGDTTDRITWEKSSLSNVVEVFGFYSSGNFVMALDSAGKLWVAGRNDFGQLGIGSTTDQSSWVDSGLANVKKVLIDNTDNTSLALTTTGDVWVAGENDRDVFGLGTSAGMQISWVKTSLSDIDDLIMHDGITANSYYAITNSGDVWVTGYGGLGTLGLGDSSSRDVWVKSSLTNIVSMYTAQYNNEAYALDSNGDLWVTGYNDFGELGLGFRGLHNTWTHSSGVSNVVNVFLGSRHAIILNSSGELWGVGSSEYGQLGQGEVDYQTTWLQLIDNVKDATATSYYSFALLNNGEIWVAGKSSGGQLGSVVAEIHFWTHNGAENVKKMYASSSTTVYVTDNDDLWGFGYNFAYDLGITTTPVTPPQKILDKSTFDSGPPPTCP